MSLDTYFTAYFKNQPGVITPRPVWYDSDDTHYENHTSDCFSFRPYEHPIWSAWSILVFDDYLAGDDSSSPEISLYRHSIQSFIDQLEVYTHVSCLVESFNLNYLGFDATEEECVVDLVELIELFRRLLEREDFDFLKICLSY